MKVYKESYNIMQYIKENEFISLIELSNKTSTPVSTIKNHIAKARKILEDTGYELVSNNKGVKLISNGPYKLPIDYIFYNSQEYEFSEMFLEFIIKGMKNFRIFNREFSRRYYTKRQMNYFFDLRMNQKFSEFKSKSNFELFSAFVEYVTLWFSCHNIGKLFNDHIPVEQFNKLLFSYPRYEEVTPFEYAILYSIMVFHKVNTEEISREYQYIICYIEQGKYIEAVDYFCKVVKFTQNFFVNDSIVENYCLFNDISLPDMDLDTAYRQVEVFAYELEYLQYERTTKVVSNKPFNITFIYESHRSSLVMVRGALRKNYPNINITFVPSWIYLYGDIEIDDIVFANTIINEEINVIPARDENGNYDFEI